MQKLYPLLGKIFIVLVILGGLALAGRYLTQSGVLNTTILNNPTPSPVAETTNSESNNYNLEVINTPLPAGEAKIITAGLDKSSGLVFSKYQIGLLTGWSEQHESKNEGVPVDTLNITKGEYSISIFQAATGGAICLYPGDAPFEGPSSTYDIFTELVTKDSISLRRSGTDEGSGNSEGFTVCQKSSDSSYQQPTGYGHIQITTPVEPSNSDLAEIDSMLKSLKKI